MTCTEFFKLTKKHPLNCTTAERNAWYKHFHSCENCRNEFRKRPKNKIMTVNEIIEIKNLIEKDLLDPEN